MRPGHAGFGAVRPPIPHPACPRTAIATAVRLQARSASPQSPDRGTIRSRSLARWLPLPRARFALLRPQRISWRFPMTRRYQHSTPWSSPHDAWSRPSLTPFPNFIILRDGHRHNHSRSPARDPIYAHVMQTQLWRPNVGIAELGEDNLFHLGEDGLEPITMVLAEIRRGRPLDLRLELGRRIVDICAEVLGVPKRTVLVEFTVHTGDEILRDGAGAGEWTHAEGLVTAERYQREELKLWESLKERSPSSP